MGLSNETTRAIFKNYKMAGIAEDDRHALQFKVVGKDSLRQMNESEGQKLLIHLRSLNQDPRKSKSFKHPTAPRADLRFIHVLWGLLKNADVLNDPTRDGLNKFIRSQFKNTWGSVPLDIDMLREHKNIDAVIQALKAWCDREGIGYE